MSTPPTLSRQSTSAPYTSISTEHTQKTSTYPDQEHYPFSPRKYKEKNENDSSVSISKKNENRESCLPDPEDTTFDHSSHEKRVFTLLAELKKYNIFDSSPASSAAIQRGAKDEETYARFYEEELKKMIRNAKPKVDILGRPPHPNQMGGDIFC